MAQVKKSVFTNVKKIVPDSIAISFDESGEGTNCDSSCRLLTSCYALRSERLYSRLRRKLARHKRLGAIKLVRRATAQLPATSLRWARLSVDGSLPPRSAFTRTTWRDFTKALRELVIAAQERGAVWHIPVESRRKAQSYRALLRALNVVVRRSSQATKLAQVIADTDCRSWVVGDVKFRGIITAKMKSENTAAAYVAADEIRQSGQTCVVCPAVGGVRRCGECVACADSRVSVVLYPYHG